MPSADFSLSQPGLNPVYLALLYVNSGAGSVDKKTHVLVVSCYTHSCPFALAAARMAWHHAVNIG